MTLKQLRDKIFNNEYEYSVEGVRQFEADFVEVWEDRFLETAEVFFLGRSVFNTANEYSGSLEELESKLQQICYGVFGFDLKGYYEMIDAVEQEVEGAAFEPYGSVGE